MNPLVAAGVLANSALYLAAVIATGLVEHNVLASRTGIAAAGVTYLCYFAQLAPGRAARCAADILAPSSFALGACAGIAVLIGG